VQILLNGMNANTAAIAQGYSEGILQSWNRTFLLQGGIHAQFRQIAANPATRSGQVTLTPAFLFNPGLVSTWFIVTGTFGVLLILNGSLVASTAMIKEREAGTVEQLLMTPAGTGEIVVAKIAPLFFLLCLMVLFATALVRIAFHVPFRGSLALVLAGAALCVLCGIGIGTFIATFTRSAQQAQLMSFFVNPPLASLSGALTPVEAMPHWMQPITVFNPIRHFGIITRAVLLKGSGIVTLWPHVLALIGFTVILLSLSVWRFRKQLG
jgi:ABC-2 type transport system permease protein